MESSKLDLEWLINRAEESTERYLEDEKFILELASLPWYKKAFSYWKIMKFIKSRQKYNF